MSETKLTVVKDKNGFQWYSFDKSIQPDQIVPRVTSVLDIAVPEKLKNYFTNNSKAKQKKTLDVAANFGTRLHEAVEKDLKNEPHTLDVDLEDAFFRWGNIRDQYNIKAFKTEIQVHSKKEGYAGTVDIIGEFDGKPCVMDLKTGFYSVKAGWQMAAYRRAAIEMGIIDDSYGMVGISVPRRNGEDPKPFVYEHIDFCELAWLSCFQTWKALYFSKLNKMKWKWLFDKQLTIGEIK